MYIGIAEDGTHNNTMYKNVRNAHTRVVGKTLASQIWSRAVINKKKIINYYYYKVYNNIIIRCEMKI